MRKEKDWYIKYKYFCPHSTFIKIKGTNEDSYIFITNLKKVILY